MEISRTLFRTIMNQVLKEQDGIEKCDFGYIRDSGYLAAIRELFQNSETESTIYLKD